MLRTEVEPVLAPHNLTVRTAVRLPYEAHVSYYEGESAQFPKLEPSRGYQTDLLIGQLLNDSGRWIPRVVVEFKLGTITTHDALTYSAKAATHKNIHPYLRYGIVIAGHQRPVPRRLIWHGHQFDFMLTLASGEALAAADRASLCNLLLDEVDASKKLNELLSGTASSKLVHRRLNCE